MILISQEDIIALTAIAPLIFIGGFAAWGYREAFRVKSQNIAYNSIRLISRSSFDLNTTEDEIQKFDTFQKRFTIIEQTLYVLFIASLISLLNENVWYLVKLVIFAIFIKLLIGEGVYGKTLVNKFHHVGIGGKFDKLIRSITPNYETYYLLIKIVGFILTGTIYYLTLNN